MSISPFDVYLQDGSRYEAFSWPHTSVRPKLRQAAEQAEAEMISVRADAHYRWPANNPLSAIKEAVAHAQRGGKFFWT